MNNSKLIYNWDSVGSKKLKAIVLHFIRFTLLLFFLAECGWMSEPAKSGGTLASAHADVANALQDPIDGTLDSIIEVAPEGYEFPDDELTNPGEPLPDPGLILASRFREPRYFSVSSRDSNQRFDLAFWLARVTEVLDRLNDPVSLHRLGQQLLAYQRGPLVNLLGLRCLEKASVVQPSLAWTANNYSAECFLIDGIGERVHVALAEARRRAAMSPRENIDSLVDRNMSNVDALTKRLSEYIGTSLSEHVLSKSHTAEHLKLIDSLIQANRLDEAQAHLNECKAVGSLAARSEILAARLFERRNQLETAAKFLDSAVGILQHDADTSPELLNSLQRRAAIMRENAAAAERMNVALDTTRSRWREGGLYQGIPTIENGLVTIKSAAWVTVGATSQTLVTGNKTRARDLSSSWIPFYNTHFTGSFFFPDSGYHLFYSELVTPPKDNWVLVKKWSWPRQSHSTWWEHCAEHPRFINGGRCDPVLHPGTQAVRVSWTIHDV